MESTDKLQCLEEKSDEDIVKQAGFVACVDASMCFVFALQPEKNWGELEYLARFLRMMYYGILVAAFGANMFILFRKKILSVLGVVLEDEWFSICCVYTLARILTVGSSMFLVWLIWDWVTATLCSIIGSFAVYIVCRNHQEFVSRYRIVALNRK